MLTEDEPKKRVAELYARPHREVNRDRAEPADPARARMVSSSTYLREVMHRVPVLIIAAVTVDEGELPAGDQAGLWGSVLPAAWSLALALRARELGTKGTDFRPGPRLNLDEVVHINRW